MAPRKQTPKKLPKTGNDKETKSTPDDNAGSDGQGAGEGVDAAATATVNENVSPAAGEEKENTPAAGEGDTGEAAGEEGKDDATIVSVESSEPSKKVAASSPWKTVAILSDDEMQVEAVNIGAYQRSAMLLRFRVDGKLTGTVIMADRLQYKDHDGSIKAR